jgi:DNA-binding CsgD family transcriptional regulator
MEESKKDIDILTSREIEVLKLIAKVYTTKEISSIIFISQTTVKSHRKALLNKFGAKNCAELKRWIVI